MSKIFRAWDVDQGWLLPPSVHEFVPAGPSGAFRARHGARGAGPVGDPRALQRRSAAIRPTIPAMMVALLLYGYSRGRLLLAADRPGLRGAARLHGGDRPEPAGLPHHRRLPQAPSGGAGGRCSCRCCALCRAAGLVKLGHVALDGTKLKANASKHKAMSYGRMKSAEAALAAEVEGWLARRPRPRMRPRTPSSWRRTGAATSCRTGWPTSSARLERIRAAKAALEAEASGCRADPETRAAGRLLGHALSSGRPQRGRRMAVRRTGRSATSPTPTAASMTTRDGFIAGLQRPDRGRRRASDHRRPAPA